MKNVPINRKRRELFPFLSSFDKFFENFFDDEEEMDANLRMMAVDLVENKDNYQIMADLPGFNKKDIDISINDNNLVIEANREEEKEEKKKSYYRCERYSGSYKRTINLTEKCDDKNVEAKYENGVLEITIPKKEPEPAKMIDIK